MAKVNKPRIHSVAKELNVNNKELIEMLEKYGMGVKNHMSTLTPQDMDIIFDYYTQKFDDGSDINEFLNPAAKEEPKKDEKVPKKASAKKGEKAPKEKVEEKATEEELPSKIEKENKSRYVDTRQNVVDLEK